MHKCHRVHIKHEGQCEQGKLEIMSKTLLKLMWVIALKQWYSVDGRVGKDVICLRSFIIVVEIMVWYCCLKSKVSHCRHKATLVKFVTGQTISTNYIAEWLLDVDLKQFKHISLVRKEGNLADKTV